MRDTSQKRLQSLESASRNGKLHPYILEAGSFYEPEN